MTLRPATLEDLPRLVAMGQHFLQATPYRSLIADNPAQMTALATMLITDANGLLLVADGGGALVGMIGLLVFSHHLSGERIAGEVFWWVEPQQRGTVGIRLLRAAEQWAKDQRVVTVQMVGPTTGRAGLIYERLGYAPIEVAYQRRIT